MKTVLAIFVLLFALSGVTEAKSLRIGGPVPPLRLLSVTGKQVDTERLSGKTLVIYFWNSQCGCEQQLLQLRTFVNGLKDRPFAFPFLFLTVNEGQPKAVVEGYVRKNGLPYEVLLDPDLKAGKNDFGVRTLPTILIVDKWGVLREKVIGIVGAKKIEEIISRYL
jgi:peroxiredoxin